MAEAQELAYDVDLAAQHSLLLDERLRSGGSHGPTSFAGFLDGRANALNEYAFLAPDEEADPAQRPLQRWVSSIGGVVPVGVQVEPRKLDVQMPRPAPRAGAQGAAQPQRQPQVERQPLPKQARTSSRCPPPEAHAGSPAEPLAQQRPVGGQAPPVALAVPVPGKPLKIRLKITNNPLRNSRSPSDTSTPLPPVTAVSAERLLASVRQLGAGSSPLLSPIPSAWAELVSCSGSLSEPDQRGASVPLGSSRQPAGQSPFEIAAAAGQTPAGNAASVAAKAAPTPAGGATGAAPQQQQQQQQEGADARRSSAPAPPSAQQQQQPRQEQPLPRARQPSPPLAAAAAADVAGSKRRAPSPTDAGAEAAPAGPAAKRQKGTAGVAAMAPAMDAQRRSAVAAAGSPAAVVAPLAAPAVQPQRQQQAPPAAIPPQQQQPTMAPPPQPAMVQQQQQQQQPSVPAWTARVLAGWSDESKLGVVAALLPKAMEQAAGCELPGSALVKSLQEEGKKLKKFSEKKMRDGRPTHISSMFLCQSCVKFLSVAAAMEAHPAKFSRESTSSMYSQTASLLDSCAHNAGRAEGPPAITAAISLLAQRLAAVARLRAAFCLRAEGMQQVGAFRVALEKASGETYQRPSPTDSNTSTSISVPLDAAGNATGGKPPAASGRVGTPQGARGVTAVTGGGAVARPPAPAVVSAPVETLVGMPKALLERQLVAAQHSQAVLTALSAFSKSSEKLREFMAQAAAQSNVHGLKVAAATLLLSADAGMGPAASVLSFAKDALDAVMQMQ